MTALANLQTLVLNADGRLMHCWPVQFKSAEDAIKDVILDRVIVVEEWPDLVRWQRGAMLVPKVVMLRQYQPISATPRFSRESVLLRDRFECQYCGARFPRNELTFDHVIPRACGGQTTWTNVLTACVTCNARKGASMPNYSGRRKVSQRGQMRPLKPPVQPTAAQLLRNGLEMLPNNLALHFHDYLYWTAELKP